MQKRYYIAKKYTKIKSKNISNFYRKLHVVSNIKYLFNGNETNLISIDRDYILNILILNNLKKHNLLDLLSKFGYTLETIKDSNKKILTREDIEKIMNNILDTKWFDKNKKLLFGKF